MSNTVNGARSRTAAFVRGFFHYLEGKGIRATVLHGGEDGFECEISDVDFAVESMAFPKLPALIASFCRTIGWQLCQVLHHETTATYCVCSAVDDPDVSVALDGCSDYQRNGTVLLPVEVLLSHRKMLLWGGYQLTGEIALQYRFSKAAVKGKDVNDILREIQTYSEQAKSACKDWLNVRWGIVLRSWNSFHLEKALDQLRARTRSSPSLCQWSSLRRIALRVAMPSGLIIILPNRDFPGSAALIQNTFGKLHFRRSRIVRKWKPLMIQGLVESTVYVVPKLRWSWRIFLPASCVLDLARQENDSNNPCKLIAGHLASRCSKRFHMAI